MAEEISAISAIRKEKLINLRRSGIEPYPNNFPDRIDTACALDKKEGETVRVAGRLMSMRVMGKSIFAHLTDSTGTIQIYIRKDTPNNEKNPGNTDFENFKNLDVGDFVGVEGKIFVTRTGEKTVLIDDYVLLCKSLLSLPEKWHKLKDTELKYRKRYLDILVNEESSKILKARTSIISSIRDHLSEKGFIEVETPILQDIPGGAAARPFVTHHNTFDIGLYLRIAPELYLKRLLVGGWDKVFEIGRNFRNEGTSTRHNPEFTMLEVYSAYTDYRYMMGLTKEIIQDAAKSIANFGFSSLNFDGEWREENMWELLTEYTKTDFLPDDSYEELKIKADKLDVPQGMDSHEKLIDRIFSKYVQPNLIQPTIVTGYLAEYSPLAKKSPSNDKIAERFEIFIGGYEIGNAYSEQNDPELQREMFKLKLNESEDQKEIDEDYIQALEYGMPPASGLGIGIDRLVMLLTGSESIREVILFPMLKPLEKLKVKS